MFLLLLPPSICQKEYSYDNTQKLVKVKSLQPLWEALAHWVQPRENQLQYSHFGLPEMKFNIFNRLGMKLLRIFPPASSWSKAYVVIGMPACLGSCAMPFSVSWKPRPGCALAEVFAFLEKSGPSIAGFSILTCFCYNAFQIS